ncbi:MAG TPA: hypothetical protein VHX65_16910 [Pirellulales bacterium]|jgi:hypothetical protein|nr:hypothetical protein [Pirellulales bacterium]
MTLDVSGDYLGFDFLTPVTYYVANPGGSWGDADFSGPFNLNNCSFFDSSIGTTGGGDDLRYASAGLIVRFGEWSNYSDMPRRGDKFTITIPGPLGPRTLEYMVESVDADPVRRKQWTLKCFHI